MHPIFTIGITLYLGILLSLPITGPAMAAVILLSMLVFFIIVVCLMLSCAEAVEDTMNLFQASHTEYKVIEIKVVVDNTPHTRYMLQRRFSFPAGWNWWRNYNYRAWDNKKTALGAFEDEVKDLKEKLVRLRVRRGKKIQRTLATHREEQVIDHSVRHASSTYERTKGGQIVYERGVLSEAQQEDVNQFKQFCQWLNK